MPGRARRRPARVGQQWDKSIIIWNLADGTQLAKLEGHTPRLLPGRARRRPARVGQRRQIHHHLERRGRAARQARGAHGRVNCLAALDGGRLASGSERHDDSHSPLDSAACCFVACGSAFEFEEVARAFASRNASATSSTPPNRRAVSTRGSGPPSAAITTQAHVFDAIAKVITADDDNTVLVERLLASCATTTCCPMKRQGVSDAAIEKLAPTALFRVVIDAKYVAGPRLLLFVEFVSFLLVMCCFARVATFDVLGWSDPWLLANKAFEKTAALASPSRLLAYFSAREVGQIKAARAIELSRRILFGGRPRALPPC